MVHLYEEDTTFEIDLFQKYYISQVKVRLKNAKHTVVSIEADGVVHTKKKTNSDSDDHYKYDCKWRAKKIYITVRKDKGDDYIISDIQVLVQLMEKNRE